MAYRLNIIQKGLDKKGNVIALCRGGGVGINEDMSLYAVWFRKGSYCNHAPNGIAYRWVYIERNLELEVAQRLFNKRVVNY
jgi:hypothetical protein